MSISSSKKLIQLEVQTKDDTADVYVIDSSFRVVKRGQGKSNIFQIKPGIYTIRVRVGFENKEQDVILTDKPEKVAFEAVEFPSAIPLFKTALTHEYQIAAAEKESRKIHVKKGEGSWIFIFTRDWSSTISTDQTQTTSVPHQGLKIIGNNNELLVDFESGKDIAFDSDYDAWSACNIELTPGQYRLSVDIEPGKSIEQTITACLGWQTQAFLLQKNYDYKESSQKRRADLTNTGILMTRGSADSQHTQMKIGGFNSQDPKMKLLDLARIGLANSHQILPDEIIERILNGKFENPMLGIIGAYLLLKNKKTKIKLLEQVVNNLRRILGEGTHPDLEALVLRVKGKNSSYNFNLPPMLRQSWLQVIKSTANSPDLIPSDSFACQNSERILSDEPWLLYLSQNQSSIEAVNDSVRYLLQEQSVQEQSVIKIDQAVSPHKYISLPIYDQISHRTQPEETQDRMINSEQEFTEENLENSFSEITPTNASLVLDNKTVNSLVNNMGLPKAKVIEILDRIKS
jgi:hypothetical protein